MNPHPLHTYISRCISLSEEEEEKFLHVMKPKEVKKKSFLLREGETCDFEAYVVKGCLKVYYIDRKGKEVILHFAIEDWWISDVAAYRENKPARLYIEALEDSQLLLLKRPDKDKLLQEIPTLEHMFRLMIEKAYGVLQQRFISTLSDSAIERYHAFLDRYPTISQRVPQHLIASYLGISPEFLSKIRNRKRP